MSNTTSSPIGAPPTPGAYVNGINPAAICAACGSTFETHYLAELPNALEIARRGAATVFGCPCASAGAGAYRMDRSFVMAHEPIVPPHAADMVTLREYDSEAVITLPRYLATIALDHGGDVLEEHETSIEVTFPTFAIAGAVLEAANLLTERAKVPAPDPCCFRCGIRGGEGERCEPSVVVRADGKFRCNDCEKADLRHRHAPAQHPLAPDLLPAVAQARGSARVAELDLRAALLASAGQGATWMVLYDLIEPAVRQEQRLTQLAQLLDGRAVMMRCANYLQSRQGSDCLHCGRPVHEHAIEMAPERQKSGHTPGPWSVDPTGDIGGWIVGTDRCFVADCTGDLVSPNEAIANARLIAAAPETLAQRDALLSALSDILDMPDDPNHGVFIRLPFRLEAQARAAIALYEKGAQP